VNVGAVCTPAILF